MSGKGVVHLEDTVDDAVFLPSASISHDLAEDVLVYIKTSRGYLAGGFDNYFSMSDEQYTYEPEFSWNYEVGLKNRMLDKENFPYDLVWSKPGAWIFLREDALFVRVCGEKGTVKEVQIPGEEGPAVLHAVVSGQVPDGLTSSDRVRYIEVKRASGIPELALSDRGGPVGWHGVRFFISMYSGMAVDNVKLPIDENCENLFVLRGLYCIPCVKFLDDDTLDVTWILIRVV